MFNNWFESVGERICTAFTKKQWVVLVFALVGFFFGAGWLSIEQQYVWAGGVILFSAACIFPVLLDMKRSRMMKGYSLVGFGAFIVVWHAVIVTRVSVGMDPVAQDTMEVLVQMFTLACAGAGGSIIAAHGDRSSTDREVQVERITITTDTQRILDLQKLTLKQTRWIKTLCILVLLVLAGVVLNIVLRS